MSEETSNYSGAVIIKYKGVEIARLTSDSTIHLDTGGCYCEADVEIEYDKPPIEELIPSANGVYF